MNVRNVLLFLSFFCFSIARATTPPVNDECTGAINLVVNGTGIYYTIAGATLSMPACTGTAYSDIWFKFTATSNRLQIVATEPTGLPVVVQVFSGTCGNLTSMGCYSYANGTIDLLNLTSGTTYYYRVYLAGANNAQTEINTYVTTLQPPPSNDEATGAIALKLDTTYYLPMGNATPSMPACASIPDEANDQWYTFVPSTTITDITIARHESVNPQCLYEFQVFSGTPSNLTSLGCSFNAMYLTGLTVGQTYYVRVYPNDGTVGANDVFALTLNHIPIPVNDECSGAIKVPTTDSIVEATLAGATLSMPACTDTAYNDIWFYFTATSTRHQIYADAVGILTNPATPTIIQVFSGTCGKLTSIACSSYKDDIADVFGLTPGETYYYRIYPNGHQNTGSPVVTSITTPGAPPVNDQPSAAIALTPGTTSNGLTLGYATESFPACNNTNVQADDVWYDFKATATSQYISITPYQTPSYNDLTFQVYSGTPAALIPMNCVYTGSDSYDSATIKNLTIDQTYYIRVYNTWGVASPSIQFDLQIAAKNPYVVSKTVSENTKYAIHPNPANGILYVTSDGKSTPDYAIADMTGRVLLGGKLTGNQINISKLPAGSFVLTIKDAMAPQSILFIKE